MTGQHFLAHGFIDTHRAGDGYIQRFDDPHLWDDKVTVGKRSYFFTNAHLFIAEYQRHGAGKVDIIETDGTGRQMRGKDLVVFSAQRGHTFLHIVKLMDGQPHGGTAAAPVSPFFPARGHGADHIHVLDTYGIAGT